jgi:xylose isomerase
MIQDGVLSRRIRERYAGYRDSEMGRKILERKTSLPELEEWARSNGEPKRVSGRQEALENIVNDYLYGTRIE